MGCEWIIATGGVIDITFNTFELDVDGSDYVEIYECTSKKCEPHELVYLNTYQTKSVGEGSSESSSAGFMKVVFRSDWQTSNSDWNYTTSSGFSASFTVQVRIFSEGHKQCRRSCSGEIAEQKYSSLNAHAEAHAKYTQYCKQ